MNDHFERYHCQMALPNFGERAQQRLQKAHILIVGMGGLGCPAAQYLVAAGIGNIGIVDDDLVSLSNLHRQILFTPADVGLPKVEVALKRLQEQNPATQITPYKQRVTTSNALDLIKNVDLVIDGTDNFETKYLLNDACVLLGKPLVYGAIYQYEGQVSIWNAPQPDGTFSANYRDIFPDAENAQIPNCAEGGVIPTLAGIVGCMQANETIKYLTKSTDLLAGKLWMMNMQDGKTQVIHLKKSTTKITTLPESVATITLDELQHMEQNQYTLIDVRSKEEHQAFHIGGENIPLDELHHYLDTLSFSKPIIFYCASGKRSTLAVRLIKSRFKVKTAFSLKGGVQGIKS